MSSPTLNEIHRMKHRHHWSASPLYCRAIKAADTVATVAVVWLTWRVLRGEEHWKLAIAAVALSGAWLALTLFRMNHLFKTYFDVLSRLEVTIPIVLGMVLSGLAILDDTFVQTRMLAAVEVVAWVLVFLLYRRNRRRYVMQGHGPVPAGCWVSPPPSVLQPGDLILTSGQIARRLHESVGHGETIIRAPDGATLGFTALMDRGALLHPVEEYTSMSDTHDHYIVMRLREPLSADQMRQAGEAAQEMIAANHRWRDHTNHRRRALISRLPLPAAWKEPLLRTFYTAGYDWLGLFMGRLAHDRWTCIAACLELYRRIGVKTNAYGTGLLGFGTSLFDPIMPVRFLSDPAFRLLSDRDRDPS